MGLGVFCSFITPALPITAGYEWKQPSLVFALVRQVLVVMKRLMNFKPQHSGSPCISILGGVTDKACKFPADAS